MYKSQFNKLFNLISESIGMDVPERFNKQPICEAISDDEYEDINNKLINEFYNSLDTLQKKVAFLFIVNQRKYEYYSASLAEKNLLLAFQKAAELENMSVDEIRKIIETDYFTWAKNKLTAEKADAKKWKNRWTTDADIDKKFEILENEYKITSADNLKNYFNSIDYNNKLYEKFSEFKHESMNNELSDRLTEKNICGDWGCQNAWGQKTLALFNIANRKHEEMKKANPEAHKMSEYHNSTGSVNKVTCTCGFTYDWDSSD